MSKESREKKITLEDDDPNAVQQMIEYLYKLDFEYYHSDIYRHFQLFEVYILADKYDIPDLRRWCRLAFQEEMYQVDWTSGDLHELVEAAWTSLPSNHKGLLKDIIKECARYICMNVHSKDKDNGKQGKDSARHLETSRVAESKEGLPKGQQDEFGGACMGELPKSLSSSTRWNHLMEDPDFTIRLYEAVIKESQDEFTYIRWPLQSSYGDSKVIELAIADVQSYLEMDPSRGY